MKKLLTKENIKQFFSYVCVGGAAAIVEWVMFAVFSNAIGLDYILATVLAFILSTTTNWLLGRVWTFRDNKKYEKRKIKEALLIFIVSAIGLLFNMLLMYIFVTLLKMDSDILKVAAKVISTGIVFFWNFLIRKLVIYRDVKKKKTE